MRGEQAIVTGTRRFERRRIMRHESRADERSNRIGLLIVGGTAILLTMISGSVVYYYRLSAQWEASLERERTVGLESRREITISGQGTGGSRYDLGDGQMAEGEAALTEALRKTNGTAGSPKPPLCVKLRAARGVDVSAQQMDAAQAACRAAGARVEEP
jgi:hypothetical protein